jgi:uncharacterized protein with gpF-like domain
MKEKKKVEKDYKNELMEFIKHLRKDTQKAFCDLIEIRQDELRNPNINVLMQNSKLKVLKNEIKQHTRREEREMLWKGSLTLGFLG